MLMGAGGWTEEGRQGHPGQSKTGGPERGQVFHLVLQSLTCPAREAPSTAPSSLQQDDPTLTDPVQVHQPPSELTVSPFVLKIIFNHHLVPHRCATWPREIRLFVCLFSSRDCSSPNVTLCIYLFLKLLFLPQRTAEVM